jgi:hypothetical protein
MPKSYKVIAQNNPSATTDTTLYTVPSATQVVISTITVCNFGASTATYRIAIRPNGESLANKHYIAYGSSVPASDTIALTLGITADASDVFTIYSSTASVGFSLFGSEIV